MADRIVIAGLKEFAAAAKKADRALGPAIRRALNRAGDLIVAYARSRYPRVSGRAVGSVRSASTQRAVRVREGGNRAPWAPWRDFGGRAGRGRGVRLPFRSRGRFLYPGLDARRQELRDVISQGLDEVAEQAGWEVTHGG